MSKTHDLGRPQCGCGARSVRYETRDGKSSIRADVTLDPTCEAHRGLLDVILDPACKAHRELLDELLAH